MVKLFGSSASQLSIVGTLESMAGRGTGVRTPGRPREFDVEAVLDRVIEVFRERGYEASSMADIERATGLNSSSIYNTFGSKETLFQQALSRYEAVRLAAIGAVLAEGTGGLDDLHRALELQQAETESEWGSQGCLAINTMTELGLRAGNASALLADFRRGLADAIRLPIERAVAIGEMRADQVANAVALLVSLTLGIGVLMRGAASREELAAHFEAAHAMVDSWRVQR
jgi:TetR/AcrR family transcriptional repressor of nem operon